jgi:phospholipid N-methyltransferase
MSKTLATYWRFLLAGVLKQAQTGAIVPSQRFLVNQMLVPIPPNFRGRIFELGAGTGALTLRLAEKCPKADILACEINPVLTHDLEYRLAAAGLGRRVRVYSGPAEQLLAGHVGKGEHPQFIISGIPLGNLDREKVLTLISGIRGALSPGGIYIQFQYSLIDRKKIKNQFSRLRTVPVLLNFPPAVVYYALK